MSNIVEVVAHAFEVAHEVDEHTAAFGAAFSAAQSCDVLFDEAFAACVDLVFQLIYGRDVLRRARGQYLARLFLHPFQQLVHIPDVILDFGGEIEAVLLGAAGIFGDVLREFAHAVDVAEAGVQGGDAPLGVQSGVVG